MSRTDFPLQSENYLSVGDSLRGLHCPQERARQRSLSGDLQANLIKMFTFYKDAVDDLCCWGILENYK